MIDKDELEAVHVLLVEDIPDNVEQALRDEQISNRLILAQDGQEALDILDRLRSRGEIPSMIVLDLNLPKVNGIEVLEKIKSGPLDEYEWSEMRQHPVAGERICGELRFARDVCPIIRHHHERWDGQGYTDALAGEMIPLLARVIGVVAAYDAMTSHRPYRTALPEEEAMSRLVQGAGTQWDPYVVQNFVKLLRTNGVQREQRAMMGALQMP